MMARPRETTDDEILEAARRCFLAEGAQISASRIAGEIGISHTTLFNRFGSKEGLLVAALGPPDVLPWAARLDSGPDERPVTVQLVEIGHVISGYFQEVAAGLSILQAAGITHERMFEGRTTEPTPVQAFKALSSWLRRAQEAERIGPCDVDTLTATLLGAMHSWVFTTRACGRHLPAATSDQFVEEFIGLLWRGIAPQEGKEHQL